MRALGETTRNDRPNTGCRSISSGSLAPKNRESCMRRYFYNSLASYLSLYIRPENTVAEIAPPSEGLEGWFANYRAVSSVAVRKTTQQPAADYILLNGTLHYKREIQEMLEQLREYLGGSD